MKRRKLWALLGIFILLASVLFNSKFRCVVVSGTSMEPTLHDGQYLVMSLVSAPEDLARDHPVCWVVLPGGHNIVKRLVGYPNQVVELRDGSTYVEGVLLFPRTTSSWDNRVFILDVDEYLFLGDNRADSYDARSWESSVISFENIRGQLRHSGLG